MRADLVQLLCGVAGLGLGLLLPRITTETSVASTRVTQALVGVGFGVLGLVSLIFTLLFLVAQWAFGSLSPRLNLFRDDPIVWRTFGLAIGVFVFSVTAALAIGNDPKVSVVVPAAEVVAVLVTLALIRTLVVKAFASVQLAPALSAIAARGRITIDDLYRHPHASDRPPATRFPSLTRTVTWPHRQAILQQLDLRRLLGATGTAVIVLRTRIGDTLKEGAPVADLHGGDMTDAAVLGGIVAGPERTFRQDPMFAFRLLADIGLRALSPAVNDPATAVQVLDTIESLLLPLASRDLDVAEVADNAGTVRVVLALPSWNDYLQTALDDLMESTDYLNRAANGKSNILENVPEETKYYYRDIDRQGQPLDGKNLYAITFPQGQLPPVKGFWSLTLYNPEHFFNKNSLSRYSLGTKNKTLRPNPDGSLTLYAGAASPGADRESNWLPAPDGTFSLYLRCYWPDQAILDGIWLAPDVEQVS